MLKQEQVQPKAIGRSDREAALGLVQLLPAPVRRRLRRLQQDLADVATALQSPRRPASRSGSLTDPTLYRSPDRPAGKQPRDTEPSAPASEAASVYFSHLDARVAVDSGQTILEAGEAAGLSLDFSCRVGGCAACALRLVKGEVTYDQPICLSDAEIADGKCLACVGRPRGEIVVESL